MSNDKEVKEKDIKSVVHHFSVVFNNTINKLPRAQRTRSGVANEAYKIESEFAYLLNDLMQSPRCLHATQISKINEFIDQLILNLNAQQRTQESKA